jgi:hypothetical protein
MTTKRWLGNAAATYDLWTVALSGTVASQTYTMTINSKSITYAATGGDTVATILAALVAAWNATYPAPPPEFQELTAAGVGSVGSYTGMTLTQKTPGKPSTISVSTSGAATFTITNTTAATGPNFFDNSQNWSGGAAPVNSDTIVFDNGNVPCKYNINTSLTGITLNVYSGYSGAIGLPFINSDTANTYVEYRTTNLTLVGGTILINSASITRCNMDFGTATAPSVRVLNCGQRPDKLTPVILLLGGKAGATLNITKGDVGIANYQGQSANFPTINMSYATNPASDANLYCGPGATLTTISKNGGNLIVNSNATTITQNMAGGVTTIVDGAITTINALAGTLNYNSAGTLGTLVVANGATATFDGDPRAVSVTNSIQLYGAKSVIADNQKRINSSTLTVQLEQLASLNNIQHGINSLVVAT